MISEREELVTSDESVFKPTFALMCGRMIGFAASFFIPVLLARLFAPDQFGTYKQLFLIYGTVSTIAPLGMAESLFYFLPGDLRNAGRYVVNTVLVLIAAGTLSVALLIQQQDHVARLMNNPELAPYLVLLCGNLLFMILSAPLDIVLVSRKRYRWAAYVYGSDLVRVIFFLVPLLFWRDLAALLWGGLIFGAIRLVASLYYFAVEFAGQLRPSKQLLREQLAYALPFEMACLLETAQATFHQYAVAHYFNAAAFAVYTVGCIQLPLIGFVASPAGNVMMVLMTEKLRQGLDRAAVALWNDTTRKLSLVFFPATAVLMVVARDLVPFLFTERYRASVPIFIIWMVTVLFSALQTDSALRVYAATRFLMLLYVVRLVAVAVLFYAFIKPFGLTGAVLASVLSMVVAKWWSLAHMRKLMHVGYGEVLPWSGLGTITAASVLACAGPLLAHHFVTLPVFFVLAASGISYSLLYLAFVWALGVLTSSERSAVVEWLHQLRVRQRPWAPSPAAQKEIGNLSET